MKLNVLLFSYNQQKFITEAINSILSQKTNFEFQLIIADDGSTDDTVEIIKRFEKEYPTKIVFLDSHKRGIIENIFRMEKHIAGDYIAILDGDDYWSNEQKIQQQIDFLENNPNYIACYHDAAIISTVDSSSNYFDSANFYSQKHHYKENTLPADVVNRLIIPTGSVVFRKTGLSIILENKHLLGDYYSLDWKIYCLLIADSKFYYFNQVWSTYRNHPLGISKSNKTQFHLSHIHFLKQLLKHQYYKYLKLSIYNSLASEYTILLNDEATKNKKQLFRQYLLNEIKRIWWFRKEVFK